MFRCVQSIFINRGAITCLNRSCLRIQYEGQAMIDLAKRFRQRKIGMNQLLWTAGDMAEYWAVIDQGLVYVMDQRDGHEHKICEKSVGDFIGGDMLSGDKHRARTVRAGQDTIIYTLSRSDFEILNDAHRRLAGTRGRLFPLIQFIELAAKSPAVLEQTPLFKGISTNQLKMIADAMYFRGIQKGETVIREGETADSMFIVQSGELHAVGGVERNIILNRFIKGQYFGELALVLQVPRTADVIAVETSLILELSKHDLDRLLEFDDHLRNEMNSRIAERVAHQFRRYQTPFYEAMSTQALVRLATVSSIRIFTAGQVVCTEGEAGHEFFCIVHGEVQLTWHSPPGSQQTTDVTLQPGAYFGDLAILRNQPRRATVIAKTRCVFMTLDREHFTNFFVGDRCTEPVAGACLKLRWALNEEISLTDILLHPLGFQAMTSFCQKEHTGENIMFWRACEQFCRSSDATEAELVAKARSIYVTYFGAEANLEVNVSSSVLTTLKEAIKSKSTINVEMFENAKNQVRSLIAKEIYPRFIESPEYSVFLERINENAYLLPGPDRGIPSTQLIPSGPISNPRQESTLAAESDTPDFMSRSIPKDGDNPMKSCIDNNEKVDDEITTPYMINGLHQ